MTISHATLVEGLRLMYRIRLFEEAVQKLWGRGQLPGAIHGAAGQEAVGVGVCLTLRTDDYMAGSHRSYHPIAKGSALGPLMAEVIGRTNGVCHGKGGSHLADFAVGSIGEDSIVGASIPIAAGAAMSALARGTGQVSVGFFGDGAANQGTFHESLNMAAIWRLPVVYVCENNQYSVVTAATAVTAGPGIAARGAAYGIPWAVVDGQDLEAVYAVADEAVARARAGDGPTLIEATTYRFREHAEGLPLEGLEFAYRTAGEISRWQERDPIGLLERRLTDGSDRPFDVEQLRADVEAEVDAAVEYALAGDWPVPEDAFTDGFATVIDGGGSR